MNWSPSPLDFERWVVVGLHAAAPTISDELREIEEKLDDMLWALTTSTAGSLKSNCANAGGGGGGMFDTGRPGRLRFLGKDGVGRGTFGIFGGCGSDCFGPGEGSPRTTAEQLRRSSLSVEGERALRISRSWSCSLSLKLGVDGVVF